MKYFFQQNRFYFLFAFVLLFISSPKISQAQCDTLRYTQEIFDSVVIYHDVKYGEAAKWSIPYDNTDLYMDIYVPKGDTVTRRPLMVWSHSGGFLNGSKNADDMMAFCDSFAKRGYVTATISYRLGFNPTSGSSCERAGYRAVQDLRAAIRYLKEKYQLYGIDTNYTFIGGSSAGALMVDQLVYLDQNEAPSSIEAGLGYPALGCLDCTGNNYQHAMDITAYVSLWGALLDSTWIQADETTPGLLVHGMADGTVPFGVGHPFGVPMMPFTHGSRCISNQLTHLGIPHQTYFVPGQDHLFYGADNGDFNSPPNAYWDTIFHKIQNRFYPFLPSDTFSIKGNHEVCQNDTVAFHVPIPSGYHLCWEVNGGSIISSNRDSVVVVFSQPGQKTIRAKQYNRIMAYNGSTSFIVNVIPQPTVNFQADMQGLTVQFHPLPSQFIQFIWNFGDGTASSVKAPKHTYPATGEYTVSLSVFDNNNCSASHTETIEVKDSIPSSSAGNIQQTIHSIHLFPNPTINQLFVKSEVQIKKVMIYSLSGKLLLTQVPLKKEFKLSLKNLSNGVYYLKLIGINGRLYHSKIVHQGH